MCGGGGWPRTRLTQWLPCLALLPRALKNRGRDPTLSAVCHIWVVWAGPLPQFCRASSSVLQQSKCHAPGAQRSDKRSGQPVKAAGSSSLVSGAGPCWFATGPGGAGTHGGSAT